MTQKEEIIEKLLHDPLNFSNSLLQRLISLDLTFDDLRECIRRIYDLSERQLRETSNANMGMMGKLNRYSTGRRIKKFNRKTNRVKENDGRVIIYAEGDSWFQFPVFITDIIDWINKVDKYHIYSEAYGGDWITNIIYESQYVSSLSVYKPAYFLISGGGNDLVGNNRLAIMISKTPVQPKYDSANPLDDASLTAEQVSMIMMAQEHITKEFYSFIWAIKAQYLLMFSRIYRTGSTQKDIICITQGYDYAIPGLHQTNFLFHPVQVIINKALDNGCWLKRPMLIRGITDPILQRAIVMTLIYEFNNMFIDLALNFGFDRIYHVDCRGLATKPSDWYDELHYRSSNYKKVANAYRIIIDSGGKCPRIIRVSEI
ncbi:MAG: hypothetical protein U0X39_01510 [Bacteroidales bacterium]